MTDESPGAFPAAVRAAAAAADRTRMWALLIIAFGVVVVLLHQARFVLSALVVAVILFSLTSDAINAIARLRVGGLRVPQWLASVVALALISVALFTMTSLILSQINEVISTALLYAAEAPEATASLFRWAGPEIEQSVLEAMRSVNFSREARALAGQAGDLMQGTILVILFVAFMFGERLRFDRKLAGMLGGVERAKEARQLIASIMHQVNYYLVVKTLVSALTGGLVYLAATLFDVALAPALGLLTFLLNYLPNVGSIVATALVALVAHVQFAEVGPTPTLALTAAVTVIQFTCGNILDPILTGRALRLSTFGILLSLAFWGLLWGVAGMFLCVPIMVAIAIVSSRTPGLRPLAILLSRDGLPDMHTRGPKPARG